MKSLETKELAKEIYKTEYLLISFALLLHISLCIMWIALRIINLALICGIASAVYATWLLIEIIKQKELSEGEK